MTEPPVLSTSRFQLRRCLGSGGFGTVYEAFDSKHNATVALKVLRSRNPDDLYRFKQEFRTLSELTHPNLITLYEFSTDGAVWFFSMELLEGIDFLSYVRGAGETTGLPTFDSSPSPFSPTIDAANEPIDSASTPQAIALPSELSAKLSIDRLVHGLIHLSQGLTALHQAGHVHRDIKPGNVLCTGAGRVVLLDFGLAREFGDRPGMATSSIVGTPDYMSPEQAEGRPASPAADWYSVGVLLYEALTGRVPFVGTSLQVLRQKLDRDAPPPTPLHPDTPPALAALCQQLLLRQPERRPGGDQVLAVLRALPVSVASPVLAMDAPHRSPPLVGRERHLAALHDAFQASQEAHSYNEVSDHCPVTCCKS